jgi:Zn-dependent protease
MNQLSPVQVFAVWVLPVLFAITVHEVAHGWIASKLGDKTALLMGRLTLNPLKHIDLVGTILVPAVLLFLGGFIFGWAKPVPVNWQNLNHPKRDMAFVAIAGPLSNLVMALIWAGIAKLATMLVLHGFSWALAIRYMGSAGILINLMLMYLNIIPIPPLDGSRVVSSLLPNRFAIKYDRIEPFGFFILLILLALGALSFILIPPVFITQSWIYSLFHLSPINNLF